MCPMVQQWPFLGEKRWMPPRKGCFRIDAYASYNEDTKSFRVGAVIWDDKGTIRVTIVKSISKPGRIIETKIIVGCYGIDLGLRKSKIVLAIFWFNWCCDGDYESWSFFYYLSKGDGRFVLFLLRMNVFKLFFIYLDLLIM